MLLSTLALPPAAPAAAVAIKGLCDKCSGHMQPCLDQLMQLYSQVGGTFKFEAMGFVFGWGRLDGVVAVKGLCDWCGGLGQLMQHSHVGRKFES